MLTIWLFLWVVNTLDVSQSFTKREVQKYQSQFERIKKRQIGSLLLTMIQYQDEMVNELIQQSIDDFESEYSALQDFHVKKQTSIYHSMQDLQKYLLDYDLLLGSLISGPQEKEKEFYDKQINRLNQMINENYHKLDQKEVQLVKMQNMLSQLIDEYDVNISAIDQILGTIDSIVFDEQKIGMQFFQKRGKVLSTIEILTKTTIKVVKLDIPMLKQIVQIGIKSNFADKQTYKQTYDLLMALRNKLVNELNSLSTDRIDQLEKEINQIKIETDKMKLQLLEASQRIQIEDTDTSMISQSRDRIKEELILLNESLRLENQIYNEREQFLLEEVNELIEIEQLLRNGELIQFIQHKQ